MTATGHGGQRVRGTRVVSRCRESLSGPDSMHAMNTSSSACSSVDLSDESAEDNLVEDQLTGTEDTDSDVQDV